MERSIGYDLGVMAGIAVDGRVERRRYREEIEDGDSFFRGYQNIGG